MTTTPRSSSSGIKGLHHNAYRCRDSEATRKFYEDFLGLPLSATQVTSNAISAPAVLYVKVMPGAAPPGSAASRARSL